MGPASGGLQVLTLRRNARKGVGYSGTPWSGHAVNWKWRTSRFSLEPFWEQRESNLSPWAKGTPEHLSPHFPGLGAFTGHHPLCPHHTAPQFPSLTPKCTNPVLTPGVPHPAPRACSSPSTALPYPPPSESKQSVSPLQLSPARPCTPSTFLQCWDAQTCSPPTHDVPSRALQSHPLYRGRTLVMAALGVHGAPSCPTANMQYTAP